MKASFPLILLGAFLSLVSCDRKPAADPEAEKEAVTTLLERYVIANETQDIELVRQLWADDSNIVVIGTERDERLVGWDNIREALEKQFRSFSDTYIAMTDLKIRLDEDCNTAWFHATINYSFTYHEEPLSYEGLGFSGVLMKIEGHWYMVQSHISVPSNPRNTYPA